MSDTTNHSTNILATLFSGNSLQSCRKSIKIQFIQLNLLNVFVVFHLPSIIVSNLSQLVYKPAKTYALYDCTSDCRNKFYKTH